MKTPAVRPNLVDGLFYPSDAEELANDLSSIKAQGKMDFMILPHGSWNYLLPYLRECLIGLKPNPTQILLISSTHLEGTPGFILPESRFFEGPLGRMNLDRHGMAWIDHDQHCFYDQTPFEEEISQEVHLPWIQYLFPHSRILTAHLRGQWPERASDLPEKLAQWLNKGDWRIIVSANLSVSESNQTILEIDSLKPESCGSNVLRFLRSAELLPKKVERITTADESNMFYTAWGGKLDDQ